MSHRPKAQAQTAGAQRTAPSQKLLDYGKSPGGGGSGSGSGSVAGAGRVQAQEQSGRAGSAVASVRERFREYMF